MHYLNKKNKVLRYKIYEEESNFFRNKYRSFFNNI